MIKNVLVGFARPSKKNAVAAASVVGKIGSSSTAEQAINLILSSGSQPDVMLKKNENLSKFQ
jgi:6-phosphogluconolactonase/glucosamine-6-phosphate isomerase/deaminase